jgi:hypothetical protein
MIVEAIFKINPKAKFSVNNGNDINNYTVEWLDGTTPISKADIEAQIPIVEFEIAMKYLRNERDKLLADTDFHALSDQTLSSEMSAYRQALRDITEGLLTVDEVNAVVFPAKP